MPQVWGREYCNILNIVKQFFLYSFMIFILGLMALKFGIISWGGSGILGFSCLLAGGGSFYKFFGSGKRFAVFFSAAVFLAGMFFLIIENFPLLDSSDVFLPSVFFILSGSSLLMYIEDPAKLNPLYAALFFLAVPVVLIIFKREISVTLLQDSTLQLVQAVYKPVLYTAAIIIIVYIVNRFRG